MVPTAFFVSILLIFSAFPLLLSAQTPPLAQYGFSLGYSLNLHFAALDSLPGIPQARTVLRSGFGGGITMGGIYSIPLSSQMRLALYGGYTTLGGQLIADSSVTVIQQGQPMDGIIRNRLESTIRAFGIRPVISHTLTDAFRIYGGGDFEFIRVSVQQIEEIIEPQGAVFLTTGNDHQILFDGTLPDISRFQASLVVGISYTLALNNRQTHLLAPELSFSFPLTKIRTEGNWSVASIRAGISLLFQAPVAQPMLYDTTRVQDTVVKIIAGLETDHVTLDTVTVAMAQEIRADTTIQHFLITDHYIREIPELKPWLSAKVSTAFVLENGIETNAAKVTMEEFIVNKYIPLLSYLFFDNNSADLPKRYNALSPPEASPFSINTLYRASTLEVYHHLLNIVGSRLRSQPKATIVLTGTTANEESGSTLAQARVHYIADYLRQVWSIAPTRITTTTRSLPETPSTMNDADGIEENRRVEIGSSMPEILEPVTLTDTLRTVDPPTIRFRTNVFSEAGIVQWNIIISQEEGTLKEIRGAGAPPAVIDWKIGSEDIRPRASVPLEYRLSVTDSAGQTFISPVRQILFEQITIRAKKQEHRSDKIIDNFSLILFDFDSGTLTERHTPLLQFIRNRLQPKSDVHIIGSTDRMGDSQHNQLLSELRANEAARALGVAPQLAKGIGEDEFTYTNNLPEGRFYSRTVRITVETPVQQK